MRGSAGRVAIFGQDADQDVMGTARSRSGAAAVWQIWPQAVALICRCTCACGVLAGWPRGPDRPPATAAAAHPAWSAPQAARCGRPLADGPADFRGRGVGFLG